MSDALRDFEQLGSSDIDEAGQAHIDLHRDHEQRIDSIEGDIIDFRARLDALEGPPGSAPPDLATLADLDRATGEWRATRPTQQSIRVNDETRLLLAGIIGRLRQLETRLAHPLIVGTYPDHAPAPIDIEFPDPAVDGAEVAHHKATILRQEQRIAELTKLAGFAQALFARITQGGGDHRDLAHVGELVLADGSGEAELESRGGMFDIEVPALGKRHGIEIRIVGGATTEAIE